MVRTINEEIIAQEKEAQVEEKPPSQDPASVKLELIGKLREQILKAVLRDPFHHQHVPLSGSDQASSESEPESERIPGIMTLARQVQVSAHLTPL